MKVTFRSWSPLMASSRYRALIPAAELKKRGVQEGTDWLVIGKHGWDWERETSGFRRVCFDVCDDHFATENEGHYRKACRDADRLTCNSPAMAKIIQAETGRSAVVIPDPYEQQERPARVHDRLLWFGNQINLPDLMPWLDRLENIEIVADGNIKSVTQWSPTTMDAAFSRAGLVIIPTGKMLGKSGNRAIESLRRGLFVVAGYLPAYADLGIYIGDIVEGVQWAMTHKEETLRRIRSAQSYVSREYSPARIAGLWMEALG